MSVDSFIPHHRLYKPLNMSDWKELAQKKRSERDALFPKEWLIPEAQLPNPSIKNVLPLIPTFLSTEENAITSTLGHQIVQKVIAKEWSAEAVAKAFCHRATITHQLTNCLTEVFFDFAIARAKQLDEHLERTGKPVGALHGLPISLKDQFDIEGFPTSMGYVAEINRVAKRNSVLVQALLDAGAILYVRTNIPQALMLGSTVNNVFGETVHPANRTLTPGGSSGGEAALVLSGGSPLGVGTDIGGSQRDPASWCGLYALRPSNGRVPYQGAQNSMFGQESIRSAAGPMDKSIDDVEMFFKAVVGQETCAGSRAHRRRSRTLRPCRVRGGIGMRQLRSLRVLALVICRRRAASRVSPGGDMPWTEDPQVIPIPWREVPIKPKYHFGVILDDGVGCLTSPASPGCHSSNLSCPGLTSMSPSWSTGT